MTVLITGAGGQLGLDLVDAFAGHPVVALSRADLDIGDERAVVDGCESDPERVHRINALGPWWLARACSAAAAQLGRISEQTGR